jgi:hypothetical protein
MKDLVCAVVICKVCRSAIALKLLVVPSCVYKWPINLCTNSNPVYGHTHTCGSIFTMRRRLRSVKCGNQWSRKSGREAEAICQTKQTETFTLIRSLRDVGLLSISAFDLRVPHFSVLGLVFSLEDAGSTSPRNTHRSTRRHIPDNGRWRELKISH